MSLQQRFCSPHDSLPAGFRPSNRGALCNGHSSILSPVRCHRRRRLPPAAAQSTAPTSGGQSNSNMVPSIATSSAAPEAIHKASNTNSNFLYCLSIQDAVLHSLVESLGLSAAPCKCEGAKLHDSSSGGGSGSGIAEPAAEESAGKGGKTAGSKGSGEFAVSSADGSAGAVVQAYRGGKVRWLSASALANTAVNFCTTRLLAYADDTTEVPHFVMEQGVQGDNIQVSLTLWPRHDLLLCQDYLERYYDTAPATDSRSYNDIWNECMSQPGWRHYQSPVALQKPLLGASISYTFKATQADLQLFETAANDVAMLWTAFLTGQVEPAKPAAERFEGEYHADSSLMHQYDRRYIAAITADPGNVIAVRMFGEDPTNMLLKMATGHPAILAD